MGAATLFAVAATTARITVEGLLGFSAAGGAWHDAKEKTETVEVAVGEITLAPGEKAIVFVDIETYDAYLSSILSFFRFSVTFESGGKTIVATVPLHVMRMEPLRHPRGD